jgi:hypothetical protein
MDPELLKKIGLAAGGALAGILGYHLLVPSPEPLYTGLVRSYEKKGAQRLTATVWAVSEDGYLLKFELPEGVNAFPEFESPVFAYPFAAALFADDLAERMDYEPRGVWAENTNEAADVRERERAKRV